MARKVWKLKLLLVSVFLLITGTLKVDGQQVQVEEKQQLVKLNSLGRTARLGSLYNAVTEQFSKISILNENVPRTLVSSTETPSTNTRLGISRSVTERSQIMDVSLTLTLSALWGLIKVSGSAHFIMEETTKSNSAVGSLVYETRTVDEMLETFFDSVKPQISAAVLNEAEETHVVVGIGYGSNVVVKFEDHNIENRDVTKVQLELGGLLNSIVSGAIAGLEHEEIQRMHQFSMQVFGDLRLEDNDYPANVSEALTFIQNIPRLLQGTNEGKGKELYFYLLPIERIRSFVNHKNDSSCPDNFAVELPRSPSLTLGDLDLPEDEVTSQIQVMEQTAIVRLKLNELANSMRSHRNIFNNVDLHRLTALENSFRNTTTSFKNKMKNTLLAVRTSMLRSRSKEVNRFLPFKTFREDVTARLEMLENSIDVDFRPAKLKLDLVTFLKSQDVLWVAREEFLHLQVLKIFKKFGVDISICAIHFHADFLLDNEESLQFVTAVLEGGPGKGVIPIVIDCDFSHDTCDSAISHEKTCNLLYSGTFRGDEDSTGMTAEGIAAKSIAEWKRQFILPSGENEKLSYEMKKGNTEFEVPSKLRGTEFTSDDGKGN